MSEHAALLLMGVASVAIAISGFSGVVAVFAGRADGKWSPAERFRTRNMLILSLVACLLSFVPLAEELFQIPNQVLWMSASVLLLGFCAAYVVYTVNMLRKPILRGPGTLVMWVRVVYFICLGLASILQALNIAGVWVERGPAPYVSGLVFVLIPAGLQFAFLVLKSLTSSDL